MRTANTILSVLQERGKNRQGLERIYRLLYNRELYIAAYSKLYPNPGNLTPGTTSETIDGMSLEKIDKLIAEVSQERFRWTPVRRHYIPKGNGKTRPLGIPTWKDKLLQEVIRMLLEAYYEPQFSKYSHGFRPARGCHTALVEINRTWKGTIWFIEGDIKGCFDNIDHTMLINILERQIKDGRFLRLIKELLEAGYLEEWKYHHTYSGTPQGGVVSPLLANIYLNELDQWVESELIPGVNKGKRRKENPDYQRVRHQLHNIKYRGQQGSIKELLKQRRTLPSQDTDDPDYRRLLYCRYADDTLFGFIGPKQEAEEIKRRITDWIRTNLRLELSQEKTLITHGKTEKASFLGYHIGVLYRDYQLDSRKSRNSNGRITLRIPQAVIRKQQNKFMEKRKPATMRGWIVDSDYDIVVRYQQIYRGLVNFYQLADNLCHLDALKWTMSGSLLRTLAAKHKTSVQKLADQLRATHEGIACYEVRIEREGKKPLIARFGGIPLRVNKQVEIVDEVRVTPRGRTEIVQRLLAETCEVCGTSENIEVHHVRKLSDLKKRYKGRNMPTWVLWMAKRNRKTLMVCRTCHMAIHAGKPLHWINSPESRMR
jgi:group II intron reverse transcriptase/maturase